MSGRETILPVLLFGVGGERSDEVRKNRSSPSLGLFTWQGSDGSRGIMFMFFGLAWVVQDLVRSSTGSSEDCFSACACVRRPSAGKRLRTRRVIVIGFRDLIPPPLLVFSAKTRDHSAHDARHLISAHKNLADKSKHSRAAAVSSSAEGRPQRKLLHVPLY